MENGTVRGPHGSREVSKEREPSPLKVRASEINKEQKGQIGQGDEASMARLLKREGRQIAGAWESFVATGRGIPNVGHKITEPKGGYG